jgi:hypothetical protein
MNGQTAIAGGEPVRVTKLDSITFDFLLASIDGPTAVFDLAGIELITPSAMVQLAAVCHALARSGDRPRILVPDRGVRGYLARAGFDAVVQNVAWIEPLLPWNPYEYLHGSNPMLIEVTKLTGGLSLPELLDHIIDVLRTSLSYEKYDAFDVATAVSEVSQNTFDHNRDSDTCGFLAMQVYGTGRKRFLEIGVADYGDGLATTLRRNPKNLPVHSDAGAILKAVQVGASEHDDPTRGSGLYHLLQTGYKHQGTIQIRSGRAKVRYRGDKRQGWRFDVPQLDGVQVALILRAKTES